jgi:hypothetical protein
MGQVLWLSGALPSLWVAQPASRLAATNSGSAAFDVTLMLNAPVSLATDG